MGFFSKIKSCFCDLPEGYTYVGGGWYLPPQATRNVLLSPPPPYTPEGLLPPAQPVSLPPNFNPAYAAYAPTISMPSNQTLFSYDRTTSVPPTPLPEQQMALHNPGWNTLPTQNITTMGNQNLIPYGPTGHTPETSAQSAFAIVTRGPGGEITIRPGQPGVEKALSMAIQQMPGQMALGNSTPSMQMVPYGGAWKSALVRRAL